MTYHTLRRHLFLKGILDGVFLVFRKVLLFNEGDRT